MDISHLSYAELKTLSHDVAAAIKIRQGAEMAEARARIMAIAAGAGISLKDLISSSSTAKVPVPFKYRHPDTPTFQWTGRGRQPAWIKDWIAAGSELTALRIA